MTHRSRTGGPPKPKTKRNGLRAGSQTTDHPSHAKRPQESHAPRTDRLPAELETLVLPFSIPTDSEILSMIHDALRNTLDSPAFAFDVQRVKGLLYERKWLEVFGDQGLLGVYAGKWVPARAACYRELLGSLKEVRTIFMSSGADEREGELDEEGKQEEAGTVSPGEEVGPGDDDAKIDSREGTLSTAGLTTHVLSLGGGAGSELIAVAAMVKTCLYAEPNITTPMSSVRKGKGQASRWTWTGIDFGAWNGVVQKFAHAIRTEWDVLDDKLTIRYVQGDLLESPEGRGDTRAETTHTPHLHLGRMLSGSPPRLITLLFTLTELLTQSRSSTLALLNNLSTCPAGTLLLVADSASDISKFPLGQQGRTWPVFMLLDAILTSRGNGDWDTVRKEDSRWYRLPEGVGAGWPVKLENTRYWMRLYRRR